MWGLVVAEWWPAAAALLRSDPELGLILYAAPTLLVRRGVLRLTGSDEMVLLLGVVAELSARLCVPRLLVLASSKPSPLLPSVLLLSAIDF